ncbi:hypothetical protein OUZ56_020631 [Daphnia magna]|uniref:Uncharacterized protein n=1 Tax=Daphnia magna TaxID=35525 RepID=A0ABQ9ZGH7_9CRUS|nr:hypothetical protein OUZ56_020631 [Daphnia magna]
MTEVIPYSTIVYMFCNRPSQQHGSSCSLLKKLSLDFALLSNNLPFCSLKLLGHRYEGDSSSTRYAQPSLSMLKNLGITYFINSVLQIDNSPFNDSFWKSCSSLN